jgi:hypothetical protein
LSDLAQLSADGLATIRRAHEAVVAPLLPGGYRLWDVHAHRGTDADGTSLIDFADVLAINTPLEMP